MPRNYAEYVFRVIYKTGYPNDKKPKDKLPITNKSQTATVVAFYHYTDLKA